MKRFRFIINPVSGTQNKLRVKEKILAAIPPDFGQAEVVQTEGPGHATTLAREAAIQGYDAVIAVGGDGSVNEAGAGLIGSSIALGIIPTGSGNGMARHLNIPVDPDAAIALIFGEHTMQTIDTLWVNDRFCIGTLGVGFDAHIAHLFSKAAKRGYSTYVKLVLTEFHKFEDRKFFILVDGKAYERNCFLLTFANSSQFGNNAVIAPFADVTDGIIDVSMMSRFPVWAAPGLIYKLMNNSIHHSRYFDRLSGKSISLRNQSPLEGHIDGEPVIFEGDIKIEMNPLSLNVLVQHKNS